MIHLPLSEREKTIVRLWADRTISGGHYGDGDAVAGEEISLTIKMTRPGPVDVGASEMRFLMHWMRKSTDTPEESEVLDKIRDATRAAAS